MDNVYNLVYKSILLTFPIFLMCINNYPNIHPYPTFRPTIVHFLQSAFYHIIALDTWQLALLSEYFILIL